LPREKLLEIVRTAAGQSGNNVDYVLATAQHMRTAGIHDATIAWLADQLGGESERRAR
jgi:cation transport protein ChaC